METRTVTMGLTACCGSGANTQRSVTKEQYDYLVLLAEDLNKGDGQSSLFTVPFFYISDWDKEK